MRRHLVPLLALSFVVASGCAGLAVDPAPSETPTPSQTAPTTNTPCTGQEVPYDISIPDQPRILNESSATALVRAIERQYTLARIRADHENVTISSAGFREVAAEPIDDGIEVTVRFTVAYSTDRLTANGGYPTTYRVTADRLVRNGRTLACWTRAS